MKKSFSFISLKAAIVLVSSLFFTRCEDSAVNPTSNPETVILTELGTVKTLDVSGFQGLIWEDLVGGGIGPTITQAVKVTFTDIVSGVKKSTQSVNGRYKIYLPIGSYYVDTQVSGYENFRDTNGPGHSVVIGGGLQTGNLALKKITYGFQGRIWEDLEDDANEPIITESVRITFTHNVTGLRHKVYSTNGFYKIYLPIGQYIVETYIAGYENYSSSPGFFVVTGNDGFQTGNFFLKKINP